jgi:putative inorganic carbon (hco3(-)) transporter
MAANRTGEITATPSDATRAYSVSSVAAIGLDTFWKLQGWGFLLLLAMSFFPRLFHVEEYLFLLLLTLSVVAAYKTGQSPWIRTPLDVPLLLFVGWVLATVPFAIDPLYSFSEWRKLLVQIIVFYWVVLVIHKNQHRGMITKVMTTVVIASAALCLLALQDFVLRGGTWQNRSVRAGAPYSDYNWLTTYLVMAIPLVAAAAVASKTQLKRLASACVGVIAFAAQAGSYTRAGWLGMVAQGVALGFFTARRQVIVWVLGAALCVGLAFIALGYWGYQKDTIDPWTLVDARIGVWKLQVEETRQHPLFGIGYGSKTFMKRFSGYPQVEKAVGPHSAFLMIAMGSGVPALVLVVWVMFKTVRVLVETAKQVIDEERRVFMLAVAIVIVGFATRNIFDYMFAGSLAYLYWLLVGTAVCSRPSRVLNLNTMNQMEGHKDTSTESMC